MLYNNQIICLNHDFFVLEIYLLEWDLQLVLYKFILLLRALSFQAPSKPVILSNTWVLPFDTPTLYSTCQNWAFLSTFVRCDQTKPRSYYPATNTKPVSWHIALRFSSVKTWFLTYGYFLLCLIKSRNFLSGTERITKLWENYQRAWRL